VHPAGGGALLPSTVEPGEGAPPARAARRLILPLSDPRRLLRRRPVSRIDSYVLPKTLGFYGTLCFV
jgi:hypothetical protein